MKFTSITDLINFALQSENKNAILMLRYFISNDSYITSENVKISNEEKSTLEKLKTHLTKKYIEGELLYSHIQVKEAKQLIDSISLIINSN